MSRDRFSVALCTYNGERFLREQLESIEAQTLLPVELVICDDASKDATADIVAEFSSKAPFPVRFSRNEKNLGVTLNFSKAIGLCAGEIIALSDQDDIWKPEKLECLSAAFAGAAGPAFVFSDAEIVDARLRPSGSLMWERIGFTPAKQQTLETGHFVDTLLSYNVVTGATLAFRSDYRKLTLPIPEGGMHDWWTPLLIAAVANGTCVREPLIKYRQHDQNQIGAPTRGLAWLSSRAQVESPAEGARRHTLALQRLESFAGASLRPDVKASLQGKIDNLNARAGLPETIWRRLPVVFEELSSGRYHRYAKGWASAFKDLYLGAP